MSSDPAADRLKKVMRIALVGIRPADQVLLKGYLRVLLRLEADLEWVSANSSQVDLFMINQEFQQAESVRRLLAEQQATPVLYIDRDDFDQGHLVGNLLTLPLKEIDLLNQWLFANMAFLQSQGNPKTAISNNKEVQPSVNVAIPSAPQTLEQIIASRSQSTTPISSPSSTQPTLQAKSQPTVSQTPSSPVAQPKNPLIDSLRTLQQRQDTFFALKQNDKIIAYLNPKFQRVWVVDETLHLNTDWQLAPITEQPPITRQPPIDLVQWLWEKSVITPTPVTSLLQTGQRYRLTSWLKPLQDEHRHEHLKIQGVLESRDSTLEEIVHVAQVSHEFAMRSVSGLIVAGVMTPAIYKNLVSVATNDPTSVDFSTPQLPQTQPLTQPVDIAPTSISAPTLSVPQPQSQTTAQSAGKDEGMKGFLSKLRRKLGL